MDKPFYSTPLKEDFVVTEFISVHFGQLYNREYAPVCYDFWQVIYIHEDTWNVSVGEKEYSLKAGSLLFNPPHVQRRHLVKEGVEKCTVSIIGFVCGCPMDCFRDQVFTLSYEEKKLLDQILDLCFKNFKLISDDPSFQGLKPIETVSSATLQLLKISFERLLIVLSQKTIKPMQKSQPREELVSLIEKYLLENIGVNLSINQIANRFFISPTSLKRMFKEVTGESVKKYFLRLKIERAKEMIIKADRSFSHLAEELGFDSASHFTSVFKKETGVTPSEYKKGK